MGRICKASGYPNFVQCPIGRLVPYISDDYVQCPILIDVCGGYALRAEGGIYYAFLEFWDISGSALQLKA